MGHKNSKSSMQSAASDSVASQCTNHIRQMAPHVRARRTAQLMERLLEENAALKKGILESPKWPSSMPIQEVIDLVRFMCSTWSEIDRFVHKHCDGDALMHYPVIQGTENQNNIMRIGEQLHDPANIHKAVKWLLDETV